MVRYRVQAKAKRVKKKCESESEKGIGSGSACTLSTEANEQTPQITQIAELALDESPGEEGERHDPARSDVITSRLAAKQRQRRGQQRRVSNN